MNTLTTQWQFTVLATLLLGSIACNDLDEATALDDAVDLEKSKGAVGTSEFVAIDSYNDPKRLEDDFVMTFDQLPLGGRADVTPWTDSYWPKNKGGISYRWLTGEAHTYESPSRDRVLAMSRDEVAQLSPAEKYDIFTGNYDYALTRKVKSENSVKEAGWTGYCHGWTFASFLYAEPKSVVMTNPDGVEVAFGSSDVKALLTYFQGEVVRAQYSTRNLDFGIEDRVIGSQCAQNDPRLPQCQDTNPGAFHVALANYVGIRKQPFGIDATASYEKWNHPVYEYATQVISREPSPVDRVQPSNAST